MSKKTIKAIELLKVITYYWRRWKDTRRKI